MVLDRYEGDKAVIEGDNGLFFVVLRDELPPNLPEGAVLLRENGVWLFDRESTDRKMAQVLRRMDRLRRKD